MSGGIAAYKVVPLVRALVSAGHHVNVVPTSSALRFVGRPTWEAISRNPVYDNVFDDVAAVRHVAMGQQADVIVIAPATAATISKLASGLSDDLLGTTVLASNAPVIVAPAMHTEMWANPATQTNVRTLRDRGIHIVGPEMGELTGGDTGLGRMSEPEQIFERVNEVLAHSLDGVHSDPDRDLVGVAMVITAGGTREAIDPVRFLGNHSSGHMGFALARAAGERGATVTLIAANTQLPVPPGVILVPVETSEQLRVATLDAAREADVVMMAAAVSDYRPDVSAASKITKEFAGERLTLELVQTPDILSELTHTRRAGRVVIGFSAQTDTEDSALLASAQAKLQRKGADALLVNRVAHSVRPDVPNVGFGDVETSFWWLTPGQAPSQLSTADKLSVAREILNRVISLRNESR